MSLLPVDYQPTRRQLNAFGVVWLAFFGYLGFEASKKGSAFAAAIWLAAVLVPIVGWLVPRFMRGVYLAMVLLTFPIGIAISCLVLGGVYFLVFTPLGLLMRAFRPDAMQRRFDDNVETYWEERQPERDLDRYFRQY